MHVPDLVFAWLLRPRVVHGLPGRLRVHVPLVRRLSGEEADEVGAWSNLLAALDGIDSAELSPVTGNVLIQYDCDRVSEQEILAFIQGFSRLACRFRDRIAALPAYRRPIVLDRLREYVRDALRHKVVFDHEVELPADLWT